MNRPRRILHVISRLDGYGTTRAVLNLAAAQSARGETATIAAVSATESGLEAARRASVTVQSLGSRWAVDPQAVARLARLSRATLSDVVHAWDARALAVALLGRAAGARGALVAGFDATDARHGPAAMVVRAARRRVAAFAARDEQAEAWLRRLAAPPDRVHRIPPAVAAPPAPTLSRAELLAELDLPPDATLIAAAGPLVRQKRLDDTIWCFELVRVVRPEVRLAIFGDGPDRSRLERFASEASEPGCVRFPGYACDLPTRLGAADVFWQLDPGTDAPQALLEALAAGVPTVASDVLMHRAVMTPDAACLLTPPGNRAEVARATDELLQDLDRARRMAAAAAAGVADRFSSAASTAAYDRLYATTPGPNREVTSRS